MSLRVRLLAAFAYVIALVLIALVVPLTLNLSRRVDAEIESEARGQAQIVAASAAGRLDRRDELTQLAASAGRDLGGRVIVVDGRGRLIADSAGPGALSTSYRSRPEIATALGGTAAQGRRHSESLDEHLLFTAVPVLDRGRTVGAVRVTQSVEAVEEEVQNDVLSLLAVGAGALGLGLAVAWVIAGTLARPERRLAATARRVAAGDLAARAEEQGSSEQREVARAFNEMTDRLARALASQRDFAANVSHQLRTPLTGMRLRLEAAAMKTRDDELRSELEEAEGEVERLARTVTALLALAREGERTSDAAVSLTEVANAAVRRWEVVASRDGRTLEAGGETDLHACISEEDVSVVLDNLVENALRHAPAGGHVWIEWGTRAGRPWIAVSDDGAGVPPAEAERVFERFYSSARAGKAQGSGLGLAIVRTLAERWGGSATLENRAAGGARAVVVLKPAPTPSRDRIEEPARS